MFCNNFFNKVLFYIFTLTLSKCSLLHDFKEAIAHQSLVNETVFLFSKVTKRTLLCKRFNHDLQPQSADRNDKQKTGSLKRNNALQINCTAHGASEGSGAIVHWIS